ncbi:AraC family transcriptional regulator [Desulfocurvus sp. DL9XJH121]
MNGMIDTSYWERMLRVLTYIESRLAEQGDDGLDLGTLAGVANFSPYHFHRIFRGMIGESVKSYIRRLRLERAAMRLRYGKEPVTGIALDSGYASHEAFSRSFRARFGMSPSLFRERRGIVPESPCPALAEIHIKQLRDQWTGETAMEVKVRMMPATRVACVRHIGPYEQCERAWEKLCAFAGGRGLLGPESMFLGVCHDDPEVTDPERIRYDACLPVGEDFEAQGDVGVAEVFGGEYAVATHRGTYANLAQTYAAICGQWAPANGREILSAPSIEHYLNAPDETPAEELLTDVYVPLK